MLRVPLVVLLVGHLNRSLWVIRQTHTLAHFGSILEHWCIGARRGLCELEDCSAISTSSEREGEGGAFGGDCVELAMELPVIDVAPFLHWRAQRCESELPVSDHAGAEVGGELDEVWVRDHCAAVAACLRETGVLVVRDPRCSTADNDRFLDMMERYFGQSAQMKRKQERPELHYQVWFVDCKVRMLQFFLISCWQHRNKITRHCGIGIQVGVTPEGVEVPRCSVDPNMQELMRSLPPTARPLMPAGADRKWRYMWRIGARPATTRFQVSCRMDFEISVCIAAVCSELHCMEVMSLGVRLAGLWVQYVDHL